MRARLTLALIGMTTSVHAEQFLWAPLDTLALNCDFCCYRGPSGGCHGAIDFRARQPRPVLAAADGTVEGVVNSYADRPTSEWTYGNRVDIRHSNGYLTRYAHLTRNSIRVHEGEEVQVGQQIALSDNSGRSTGPHLHFEVRDPAGRRVNPYGDPPDYDGGCGTNPLWATCPPQPWRPEFADTDGDGWTGTEGDCDDGSADIHPVAEERCDGVDNNCMGGVDELFVGLGTECTIEIGSCRTTGTWVCSDDGEAMRCTAPPAGDPSPEICDGQDNDCNGLVDDADASVSCQDGLFCNGEELCVAGVCVLGPAVVCNDGVDCTIDLCFEPAQTCSTVANHIFCNDSNSCTADECTPTGCLNTLTLDADSDGFLAASCLGGTDCNDGDATINPGADELCDGVDNNCAAGADELWPALGASCTVGLGICANEGVTVCNPSGSGTMCDAAPLPAAAAEVCNGADDDCEGVVDNIQPLLSYTGPDGTQEVGICRPQMQECLGGAWVITQDEVLPEPETIDGFDNDCDGLTDPWQLSASGDHTCGVGAGYAVICWGDNALSQSTPPSGDFLQVSAGYGHTCGVRTNNTSVCWGSNSYGRASAPSGAFVEVGAGGYHSCGLRTDGTITCWGDNSYGQTNSPSGTFSHLEAGWVHTCAIRLDDVVICWGYNEFGQAADPLGTFVQISSGGWHNCGVRDDSTVYCWGRNNVGQIDAPAGAFDQVSAGWLFSCGIRNDQTVVCWGSNLNGQSDPPLGSFLWVAAGGDHTCGTGSDNILVCWGINNLGQSTPP